MWSSDIGGGRTQANFWLACEPNDPAWGAGGGGRATHKLAGILATTVPGDGNQES